MPETTSFDRRRLDLRSATTLVQLLFSRHGDRRRALATLAKVHGYRLERRTPFLIRATGATLNFDLDDLLEFQYARRHPPCRVLSVGAFDALTNDRLGLFVQTHRCVGTFLEPQPHVFEGLRAALSGLAGIHAINAAVGRKDGLRTLYYVDPKAPALPAWTQQIASFDRGHLLRHESDATRISPWIRSVEVTVIPFDQLLRGSLSSRLDVLQIDTEGHDSELLSAFPFDRIRPGVLHFEIAHMDPSHLQQHRERLRSLGYSLWTSADSLDQMALHL